MEDLELGRKCRKDKNCNRHEVYWSYYFKSASSNKIDLRYEFYGDQRKTTVTLEHMTSSPHQGKIVPALICPGIPGGSVVKNLPVNGGDLRFNPRIRKIPWRRKWQPTPVFLLGKSQGQRRLVGYRPWVHKQSSMTEHVHMLICPWVVLSCSSG